MNRFNFFQYNKEEEEEKDGDYWKFLDASSMDIINNDLYLDKMREIIRAISNNELKIKLKNKLFDLIVEKGIFFKGLEQCLDIFSSDEIKYVLEREFNKNLSKYLVSEDKLKYRIMDIMYFIEITKSVNDSNWEYLMITKILDTILNITNKSLFVNIIEFNNQNEEIYNKLLKGYYNYFPDEYKNFLEMKKNHNYIYNKSLKFMNEDIDIGIDPRISIGPEIEANNDYCFRLSLFEQTGFENFVVTNDPTVPNGKEIAPRNPFYNKKEDIAKFCGLCEALKDIGYYYSNESQNASGQINLGLDYLDTKEAILNFYEIYGNCEELLYYICNEEGQLFRQDVYTNSRIKPISEIVGKCVLDEELSRDSVIKLFNNNYYDDRTIKGLQYKKNSVCLRGSTDEDYRLEFRIPNGGCNYRTWIDNIRLFGKMMEIAKILADSMKKDYLSSEEEDLLRIKIDLQDNNLSNKEKLVLLMNLLFKDDNIKQIYYKRYISTIKKIEETNSDKYRNHYYNHEPNFDDIEFLDQYESRFDPDYSGDGIVIEYDPEYGIVNSSRKK